MGYQSKVARDRRKTEKSNPSNSGTPITCVLCGKPGGIKYLYGALRKTKDPISKETVYFHKEGCGV